MAHLDRGEGWHNRMSVSYEHKTHDCLKGQHSYEHIPFQSPLRLTCHAISEFQATIHMPMNINDILEKHQVYMK